MSEPLDTMARRGAPVEKVTTFVLDQRAGVNCLLLLYHPYAGIQLPAGTVEAGESAKDAALREAQEETGLADLVWGGLLGEERFEFPPDAGIVAHATPVYTRPAITSEGMGSIRRGFTVEVVRAANDFVQIHYMEHDRYPNPQFTSFELLGWVPADAIAGVRVRYFAWLTAPDDTPASWTNFEDHHTFTLRWHPLNDLPELVTPQAPWLRFLPKASNGGD
jgi:8-oxo-dGTP pyrophosphatase MutT (NUDIX family)